MGRYRSKSRSYSPRSSRSPSRRKRYDEPRDRYGGSSRSYIDRRSSAPSGLLIRNISLDARPEDLRIPFERFGPVKDVYLPRNYYTGEPRGFGFVKFHNGEDAAEAKEQMNHQVIGGREIRIVFAEENRKSPQEMRRTMPISDRYGGGYRRRSPPRSPRRRHHSYSRSPSPARRDSSERVRGARDDYYSSRRSISRSPSLRRSITRSRSPRRPITRSRSPRRSISRSPSLRRSMSRSRSPLEKDYASDRKLPSPRENGGNPSRSRSYSPR